jgi:hypothetical protein
MKWQVGAHLLLCLSWSLHKGVRGVQPAWHDMSRAHSFCSHHSHCCGVFTSLLVLYIEGLLSGPSALLFEFGA